MLSLDVGGECALRRGASGGADVGLAATLSSAPDAEGGAAPIRRPLTVRPDSVHRRRAMLVGMAYVGNLTCRDCGLTFTERWGSTNGADEYRCEANDHVVLVCPESGQLLGGASHQATGRTLADVFGRCPACQSDLVTGLLPSCPVCSGRDHEVAVEGVLG